jgi:hypothetical protein
VRPVQPLAPDGQSRNEIGWANELFAFGHGVTVADGFDGVTKIAGQLRRRGCRITDFRARRSPRSDIWVVQYFGFGTPPQIRKVRQFVDRLPGVTGIEKQARQVEVHNGACGDPYARGSSTSAPPAATDVSIDVVNRASCWAPVPPVFHRGTGFES